MSNYKHGNWYCKPANEAEAKEIIERAVASGAKRQETLEDYYWNDLGVWGVYRGRTLTQNMDFYRNDGTTEYTIEQVREKFPLLGEREWNDEGLPPAKVSVEVFHQGRWIHATTVGEFGHSRKCMVCAPNGGGFYGFYANEIRPIRSERDQWCDAAAKLSGRDRQRFDKGSLEAIWDGLKSGDLKAPEVE